ncbi:MAG: hypothetical protein QOH39_844 [Verrucomicrobiota bacterium]
MTADERIMLEKLEEILRSDGVGSQIPAIVERVRKDLTRKAEAVMAWEPIPLEIYENLLPRTIRSSWVFILRRGADTGAERHPNSHQRMMSFAGSGDLQTDSRNAGGGDAKAESEILWHSNILVSDPAAPLETRWVSIPENVWHRPVVAADSDWIVVSFHTVPAEALIEERPDRDRDTTTQMRYLQNLPAQSR